MKRPNKAWDWARGAWDCKYCGRRRRHAGQDPADGHELPIALQRWLYSQIATARLTQDSVWVMDMAWLAVVADLLGSPFTGGTAMLLGLPVTITPDGGRPHLDRTA